MGDPYDWTLGSYNGTSYDYAFYNLPGGQYYVVAFMDVYPFEGDPGAEDPFGEYLGNPVLIDLLGIKDLEGIDFTLP